MNTKSHNLPRRVIIAAAILANRYSNADAAAFNRATRNQPYPRRYHFWFSVGRALGAAYGYNGGVRTDYEWAVRCDIEATRAQLYSA